MPRRFEWDSIKAEANRKKHGVSFETAARAFADPFAVTDFQDAELSEPRWQTIAMADEVALLVVVHTDWEDGDVEVIRLISARLAERRERRIYEENYRNLRN